MKDTRHLILFFNGKNIEFVFGHSGHFKEVSLFLLACIAGVLFRSRNRHVEFQKLRGIEANANLEDCFFYFPNPFLYKHVSRSFSRTFLDKRSKMQSRKRRPLYLSRL